MTAETLPGLATPPPLGLIGKRQLICVQTFNIARLTSHPVVLIPGEFIAVTGKGPKDSNESGKTSFLAALSLLLGDPEWRTRGTGTANVAALLFDPTTAGDSTAAHAAEEGYIVGVFADPDSVTATAHTVWLRISSRTPHVQIRHTAGVFLVTASSDQERHELAPKQFQSISGPPLRGSDYPDELYGRTPRVIAYVATRGKIRSRPSLLKLDTGTFTPEQIGDILMSITGRAALFENDADIRRKLAATQARLAEVLADDEMKTEREEAIRRQVEVRNRLREKTTQAKNRSRSFHARRLIDAHVKAASSKASLARKEEELTLLRERLEIDEETLTRLRDVRALRRDVEKKEQLLKEADDAYEEAIANNARLRYQLQQFETSIAEARRMADGYDLHREDDAAFATQRLAATEAELEQAQQSLQQARSAVKDADDALRQAREGRVGMAGVHLQTLRLAGVDAAGLADGVHLTVDSRESWETRIAPWREAVCVEHEDLPAALRALRDSPGAIIISPPDHRDPESIGTNADAREHRHWPQGILEAPLNARTLLHALDGQHAQAAPIPHVADTVTGVHIVGGFTAPVVGRQDICAHFAELLRHARNELASTDQAVAALELSAEQARDKYAHAQAAQRVLELEPQIATTSQHLTTLHHRTLPQLRSLRNTARDQSADAKQTLKNRTEALNNVTDRIRRLNWDIESITTAIERLRATSRPNDHALASWPWGMHRALIELGWPAKPVDSTPFEQVVDEATPPPQDVEKDTIERRSATTLARASHALLMEIVVTILDRGNAMASTFSADVTTIANTYRQSQSSGDEDLDGSLFDVTLSAVETWLDSMADRDIAAEEQIEQQQATRKRENEYIASQVEDLARDLNITQQAIRERAETRLDAISSTLNNLNRAAGGLGADLKYDITSPSTPSDDWICQVTPRWRRNTAGRLLPYDTITNTAQEKLFSIHLVLAALLATADPSGRVLILDELGDSLGIEHRRDVLRAIATAARDSGITVLGTCQDSIMLEARPFCGQVLYFHYPSRAESLNLPTRMFGYDDNSSRVELTAEALLAGRNLLS